MAEAPWRHVVHGTSHDFIDGARERLRVARELGREREAEADLRTLGPDVPDTVRERAAFVLWALLARQEGRDADDELDLRTAILGRPGIEYPEIWGGAWYELGYFLILIGDVQAAEMPMRRAIECGHPDVVDQALCNLGVALAAQHGRKRDAELLLRQATIERPDDVFAAMARCELAMLFASQHGRENEADGSPSRGDRRSDTWACPKPTGVSRLSAAGSVQPRNPVGFPGRTRARSRSSLASRDRVWRTTIRVKRASAADVATPWEPNATDGRGPLG